MNLRLTMFSDSAYTQIKYIRGGQMVLGPSELRRIFRCGLFVVATLFNHSNFFPQTQGVIIMNNADLFQTITLSIGSSESATFELAAVRTFNDPSEDSTIPVDAERMYGYSTQGFCVIA